ncbi:MAG: hypothetical protein GXP18_03785 [Gammaproteobacteria bacterium]|nr:hypothetical protein [Gammaproteobacteria bacterium]
MLNKKGMTKFTAVDISFCFLAHKNAQDKLLDEFSEDNFRFVEILDRTCQGHSAIQIHASQIWLKKVSLTSAQFQKQVREEATLLKKYENP